MGEIYVEVASKGGGDLAPRISASELLKDRIDELGASLSEIATMLRDRLDQLPVQTKPKWGLDQVEVKFSFDLQAEAGVIIARTSAKAGFEATLVWKQAGAPS